MRLSLRFAAAMALPALVMACAPAGPVAPPPNVPFSGLAGSSWELVELHIAADGQGSRVPRNSADYTIAFAADGSASLRLDCNRGTGPWRNDIANATGGTLAIGPLAVTRALCPAPSLGEGLEAALGRVRNFTIDGNRLRMTLGNSTDVIVWEAAGGRP